MFLFVNYFFYFFHFQTILSICLSTVELHYISINFRCQELFYFFVIFLKSDVGNFVFPVAIDFATLFPLPKTFKSKKKYLLKEERRKRDLNPRAGHPTYTLSRGASSAS